ncbi:patatin-like phospholipase family protein [Roseovarius sp. ZX-A-9]|uniref:patatin-like phospholipase family protein n=1 Tax=Roseovarius sp. ZX-A-9 TaxID=3014783 RepID=UPI00232BA7AF|nr:patatin-like phospholipase family protein [Roseovarius sp. ZX-A-9]
MPSSLSSASKTALVLQGGGARGAYQVGVLKAIAEITNCRRSPFQIVCGASVGAINAAPLAAASSDFQCGMRELETLWRSLRCSSVYDTRTLPLVATALRWAWTLLFGHFGVGAPCSFLNNAPLGALLEREFDQRDISRAISAGTLHALCITASSYDEGKAVTFVTGHDDITNWARARRRGVRTEIGPDHLLASSSLPFVFAPVRIDGEFYGDGSLRLTAPLSPAIRTGADRVLVIAARDNIADEPQMPKQTKSPSIGEMAGHALDIMFNDNLDADHERMSRVNQTLSLLPEERRRQTPLRVIDTVMLSPSKDLRRIAGRYAGEMPFAIRLLMRTLGSWGSDGRLISYLLFESSYISALIDLGYADTMEKENDVRDFLLK